MFFFFANPILILSAVIPAVILLVVVCREDRVEPEPPGLILSLVFAGIVSTFCAMVAERLGDTLLTKALLQAVYDNTSLSPFDDRIAFLYYFVMYFCIVGPAEEGFKYMMLKRRTWDNPEFNYQFDGIVYATAVSMGFALWENIGYVAMYGLRTALVRSVTAIPGHACFGIFMGIWYGFAKKYETMELYGRARFYRVLAVLLPALLHGCYDFTASFSNPDYAWVFVAFVVVLFFTTFVLLRRMAEQDEGFYTDYWY